MKTVSSALTHGITQGVSKKKNDGWTVYPRGDGSGFGISFRISVGVWRDRRIPPSEARTEVQAGRWARANVERLRAGEPVVPATPAKPVLVRVRDLEDPFLTVRSKMGIRPATLKQDESTLRAHIIPGIGNLVASEVTVATLLVFSDTLVGRQRSRRAPTESLLSVVSAGPYLRLMPSSRSTTSRPLPTTAARTTARGRRAPDSFPDMASCTRASRSRCSGSLSRITSAQVSLFTATAPDVTCRSIQCN